MKVLSVTSECAPLIKTGGLADVAGALPGALAPHGCTLRTLLPGYPKVMAAVEDGEVLTSLPDLFGGSGRIIAGHAAGLDLLVLDAPHLYARDGSPYLGPDGQDWPDNPERFAALCWAAMLLARDGLPDGWTPDVVHGHDWQAGLMPYFLQRHAPGTRSVLSVHNIAFQGLAPPWRLGSLRVAPADFHPGLAEYYGQVSALKTGLICADRLSTVSPTYARELLTPEFGMGLQGVLRDRRADLVGILNGIDLEMWNPANDPDITPYTAPSGKAQNRAALQAEFGLPDGEGPLCIVVSRLTEQKGLDVLLEALPALTSRGGRLALLGSGQRELEAVWRDAAVRDPNLSVHLGYDEALSHRMMAGADAILIPSRFEPCGLTQLYGLRYGTIPLVALTGGLADTVIDASDAGLKAGAATGVTVYPLTAEALTAGLERLCTLFSAPKVWTRMQSNAMRHPVGWDSSGAAYAALYRDLAGRS
ncbi:glycogen synthase GlgA [Meridianimarinicoccus roseus]|uniref:Glycogen synthase n=1 Tax=Meridianimarinicoccus roseus TaxID=2072018 RepID=A0A2V2LHY8_9RHOB|nr:glycogen synthase GlgA [Meridianimarinicoccus roseus]PWR03621.1 glycogen synthase GlgA [Meridianimarinicoccus roseus]